jgi:hypothetical protein
VRRSPDLTEIERRERRIGRLRDELLDDGVSLPQEDVLLEELDYARHPPTHEGVAPRFGAVVTTADRFPLEHLPRSARVEPITTDLTVARKLADGRASFIARSADGSAHLVCLDRIVEDEAAAIDAATKADVFLLQRRPSGWVRVCSPDGVITWDGTRWAKKPPAARLVGVVQHAVPEGDVSVILGLLELGLHWLSAGRVGALLVWAPARDPRTLDRLGMGAAFVVPPMLVTHPEHLPALLSVLAQSDRAALVGPDGCIDTLGVALRPSRDSIGAVEPFGGTRHTSAQRYSYDHPDCVVIVVSAAGPMTVFRNGAPIVATGPGTVPALG